MTLSLPIGLGAYQADLFKVDWETLAKSPALFALATLGVRNAEKMDMPSGRINWLINEYLVKWGVEDMFKKALVIWPYSEAAIEEEKEHLRDRREGVGDDLQWPRDPLSIHRWEEHLEATQEQRAALAMEWLLSGGEIENAEILAAGAGLDYGEVAEAIAQGEALRAAEGRRASGLGGGVLVLLALVVWWLMRRK